MAKEQRIHSNTEQAPASTKKPAPARKDTARKLEELEVGAGDSVRGGGNIGDI